MHTQAIRAAVLLLALLFSTACNSQRATDVRPSCAARDSETFFFAGGTFGGGREDLLRRRWYSGQLGAMAEPSLSCGEVLETYRFTWLRSFHEPIAVRAWRTQDTFHLEAVVLDGPGGQEQPQVVSKRISRTLSASEWARIEDALIEIGFWRLATSDDAMGLDGAQWIIEGRDGRYHVVDRWNGADGVQEAGRVFLEVAGLSDVEPIY